MNWSKAITLTDLPGRNLCRSKKYVQPAGISLLAFGIWWAAPAPALTGSPKNTTWFINVHKCLECFPTSGPYELGMYNGTCWNREKNQEGGRRQKRQASWSRYEDVSGGGLLANPKTENKFLSYIQGSEPNVATGYRVYSLLAQDKNWNSWYCTHAIYTVGI